MYVYIFKPERLKARRKELKLSGRDLGQIINCDHSALNKIENGKRNPSSELLGRIAGALSVTPNYFFEKEKVVD